MKHFSESNFELSKGHAEKRGLGTQKSSCGLRTSKRTLSLRTLRRTVALMIQDSIKTQLSRGSKLQHLKCQFYSRHPFYSVTFPFPNQKMKLNFNLNNLSCVQLKKNWKSLNKQRRFIKNFIYRKRIFVSSMQFFLLIPWN